MSAQSAATKSSHARRSLCVLALLFAACGDQGEASSSAAAAAPDTPTSTCDAAALTTLSSDMGKLSPREGSALVWPGLKAACGDALPGPIVSVFDSVQGELAPGKTKKKATAVGAGAGALKEKSCPDVATVSKAVAEAPANVRGTLAFKGCKFDRYGVLSDAEVGGTMSTMMSFATHQWLLDQGVDAALLKPVTRALYALERRSQWMVQPVGGERWPVARGHASLGGLVVHVTRDAVHVNGRKIVALKDGKLDPSAVKTHLIPSLFGVLAKEADKAKQVAAASGETWNPRVVFAADADTPYATMVDLMYTAGRAEFSEYSIALEDPAGFGYGELPLSPPRFGGGKLQPAHKPEAQAKKTGTYAMKGPKDAVPQMARNFDPGMAGGIVGIQRYEGADGSARMTLELTPGAFTMSQGADHKPGPVAGTSADYAVITSYAKSVKAEHKLAHRVALSASNDTLLREVVAALVAARGPECVSFAEGCVLPDVIILAGDAHGSGGKARGILGVMSQQGGHFLASPYGGALAVGNDDEDVWGGLTGSEVGVAFGVGGLGLVGTGRGGGGTGEGSIGIGNTGLIGKGGGGGKGSGYGRGSGNGFGGTGKRVPRVRQAKSTVDGALDKDIVRRIVRAHINEVRSCYNKGLEKDPELEGRMTVKFVITSAGKVSSSTVADSSLADASVATCVAKAIKTWKFPKPRDGGDVNVSYPFVLSPG